MNATMPGDPLPAARMCLAGRYVVEGLLGVGGMGSVYRARDLELDEMVALKVLRRELLSQPGILERFRREVKLARRVTHLNVARVFDIGEHAGEKFITMELIEGESLGARIARVGPLPVDDIVAIAASMGEGLAAAHAAGVIHRDLKPDNVLLAGDGRVVVTDFGIARAIAAVAGPPNRTVGLVLGTPEYMAPEQVEARPVDARTDVYAWGVSLYEMATGRAAWTGDSVFAVVTARMTAPPPDPRALRPDLPAWLAELVLRMLARDPDQRPRSARDVVSVLRSVGASLTERPPSASRRPPAAVAPRQQQPIAVVPLACRDPDAQHTAFGIAELIADALDGRSGTSVRARGARLLGHAGRELSAVGAELDVPLVVGGRLEGGSASISLVNARDGFVLWSRQFPTAARDPYGAAYDAAREIAEALLVSPAAPPAAPPGDARTVELLLRARFQATRAELDATDRVIALLERAYSRAPMDPWVNASYALSLARRLADTEFPGDADEALAMANTAVELAPRLSTAHQALAEVLLDRGDLVGASRAASRALSLAPGSAEVQRLVAHLHLEAGNAEAAAPLLRAAATRDVPTMRDRWDEARALMARGRHEDAEELLADAAEADRLSQGPWLARVRCALLRRDLARCELLRVELGEAVSQEKHAIIAALDAVLRRAPLESALAAMGESAFGASRQAAIAMHKLATDVAATVGDTEAALAQLSLLEKDGAVDLAWLDHAPTLTAVRKAPAWVALRGVAARKAQAISKALAPDTLEIGGPS